MIELTFLSKLISTTASKECDICHYWHFLSTGFKFQTYVYNRCHDLLTISMNLSTIAILKNKILIFVVLLVELVK